MANIFITYGDKHFKESLVRIRKQAKSIGIFDKIIAYAPQDLPSYITSSPLFAFERGGGYWLWKPYIIYKTLQECREGDVVYYADAGCRLNPHSTEWVEYSRLIKDCSSIFFQYRSNFDYGWRNFRNNSVSIKYWMKSSVINYFKTYFQEEGFLDYNKIMGGFCIIRKEKGNEINIIIDEWLKISLFHPELLIDPFGVELGEQTEMLNAHRHDQSIITPLVYYYKDKCNIKVLKETSESDKANSAVAADRYKKETISFIPFLKIKLYPLVYGWKSVLNKGKNSVIDHIHKK